MFLPAPDVVRSFAVGTAFQFTKVVTGPASYHTLALKANGTLWAWGDNTFGELGDGFSTSRFTPAQVGTATNWSDMAAGEIHSLALRTDGTMWAMEAPPPARCPRRSEAAALGFRVPLAILIRRQ